jgi:precorrin-2 dehydrogenase/sirohydrochlorin ferrochelatase
MLQRLKVKTMRYYPINLDIRNRDCLVVGGGGVGTRKVATLLHCGAKVTAVSPDMSAKLRSLVGSPGLTLKQRSYRSTDLEGMFLVIGATDDETLNRRISRDAEQRGTLCNIADRPEICNFILPAIVHREDLVITVSTSGKSPALAKKLRKSLETRFGEEYGTLLKLMGGIRKKLLNQSHEPEAHKPIFERLINSNLITLIKEGRTAEVNALLFDILGEGYRFDELIN